MEWMKIGYALLLGMALITMWPAYKWWSKNSPKAQEGDWNAALLAIAAVAGFVVLLILLVR